MSCPARMLMTTPAAMTPSMVPRPYTGLTVLAVHSGRDLKRPIAAFDTASGIWGDHRNHAGE